MGSVSRTVLKAVTLLFFAGNTLLLIMIILSGAITQYPIDRYYWLQADTNGIPNAEPLTRWTFWGACSRQDGKTYCGDHLSPAAPISPVDNFNTKVNVPNKFIKDRNNYYYLSRFTFCFFWIALAFIGVAFLLYALSWCSNGMLKVVFILSVVGCIFDSVGVILQTAVTVSAKKAFSDGDRDSKVGAALMGMAWASFVISIYDAVMASIWWFQARRNVSYNTSVVGENEGFFHRKRHSLSVPDSIEPYPPTTTATPAPVMNENAFVNNDEKPIPESPMSASVLSNDNKIDNSNNNLNVNNNVNNSGYHTGGTSTPNAMDSNSLNPPPPAHTQQSTEGSHKGIKFFTVRRNHANDVTEEEESV